MEAKLVKINLYESTDYSNKDIKVIGDKVILNIVKELDALDYSDEKIKSKLVEISKLDLTELDFIMDMLVDEAAWHFNTKKDIDKKFINDVIEYITNNISGLSADYGDEVDGDDDDDYDNEEDYYNANIEKNTAKYAGEVRRKPVNIGRAAMPVADVEKNSKVPKEKGPRVPSLWNRRKYDKWIKEMSWREKADDDNDEEYADFGYEMAQNAKYEPGLIDYVRNVIKREYGDESPLERIQWDIERHL